MQKKEEEQKIKAKIEHEDDEDIYKEYYDEQKENMEKEIKIDGTMMNGESNGANSSSVQKRENPNFNG